MNQPKQKTVETILVTSDQPGERIQISAPELSYVGVKPHLTLPSHYRGAYHIHTTHTDTTGEASKKTQRIARERVSAGML